MDRLLAIGARSILYRGPLPQRPIHRHSAAAVVVGISAPIHLRSAGADWHRARSAFLAPGVPYELDAAETDVAVFFAEPESNLYLHLARHHPLPATTVSVEPALPTDWAVRTWSRDVSADDILGEIERVLVPGSALPEVTDSRISAVTERMRAELEVNHPAADLAALVLLSPSRLSALFRSQVGVSLRRYRIWLRLRSAATAIGRGLSLSDAAALAGFADAAHFSLSTRKLLGVSPSEILGILPRGVIRS